MKCNKVLEHFEAYFGPRKNITYYRFKSFTYRQKSDQTFDDCLTEMRKLSSDFDLLEFRESLLRDTLIIGLNHKNIQERLLRESNLDLTKTLDTCRTVDADEIRKRSRQHKTQPRTQSFEIIDKCKFCLYSHKRGSCPAYAKRKDISQSVAEILIQKSAQSNKIQIVVAQNIDVVQDEENSSSEKEWTIDLSLNRKLVSFSDSGVPANVIPENCFKIIKNKSKLHKSNAKLTAYNGREVVSLLKDRVFRTLNSKEKPYPFCLQQLMQILNPFYA